MRPAAVFALPLALVFPLNVLRERRAALAGLVLGERPTRVQLGGVVLVTTGAVLVGAGG